eukprot:TRINITY_DN5416_c0_g1_i2.p1 TRINITY_DN5416_c0_g1~~TRINITY_DN5416_c0_g1_i2.p1  ORF type:complete len:436 (-),score=66.72 TRINITY_DN5416_c0_g1_i2:122-1396(-)
MREQGKKDFWHWLKLCTFVAIYWIVVALIPINNKIILSGFVTNMTNGTDGTNGTTVTNMTNGTGTDGTNVTSIHGSNFPYPLSLTFFELVSTIIGLLIICLGKYYFCDKRIPGSTWVGGPRFLHKLRFIAPVGVIFGFKLGLTNYGLKLVPAGVHLLLQSSSLFWTVLFSFFILKERPTFLQCLALIGTVAGTIMVSYDLSKTTFNFTKNGSQLAWALVANLSTTVLEGAAITFLRYGTQKLSHEPGYRKGEREDLLQVNSVLDAKTDSVRADTNMNIGSFEFTLIKLCISALVNLPFVIMFEYYDLASQHDRPFTSALHTADPAIIAMIFASGGLLTLIFQTNITALTVVMGSISVGVVGDVKVIPQTLAALIAFHKNFVADWLHVLGLITILLSVFAYGMLHMLKEVGFLHDRVPHSCLDWL